MERQGQLHAATNDAGHASTSGRSVAAAASGKGGATAKYAPTHLIILANGLFGSPANWSTIKDKLSQQLDASQYHIHASDVNKRTDTYDGIDVCGQRLADEIRGVVRRHPTLTRITVIGHSMGGLLLRYAIGVLYDPATGRIAGLQPAHFVTLATPHLGCEAEGVSQVPFVGWLGVVPPLGSVLRALSVPTARLLFKRTGAQFFLDDAEGSSAPLLARMTRDDPARGAHWWSALAAFKSRTAYANTCSDHLVGWANSSLRFMHQLPALPPEAAKAKGVVLADALLAAFDVRFKPSPEPQSALSSLDLPVSRPPSESGGGTMAGGTAAEASVMQGARGAGGAGGGGDGGKTDKNAGGASVRSSPKLAQVEAMLVRLQSLSWRRIDVCFKGAVLPFAHNHIQVTRRWLNFEGDSTAEHVAHTVSNLEAAWAGLAAGHVTTQSFTTAAPATLPATAATAPAIVSAAPPSSTAPSGAAAVQQPASSSMADVQYAASHPPQQPLLANNGQGTKSDHQEQGEAAVQQRYSQDDGRRVSIERAVSLLEAVDDAGRVVGDGEMDDRPGDVHARTVPLSRPQG